MRRLLSARSIRRVTWYLPLLLILLLGARPAFAGHGLMNSFGGIPWLPTVDTVPGSFRYRLGAARDELRLQMASSPVETMTLAVAQSRQRLAAAELAVRTGKAPAASSALDDWGTRLALAEAALAQLPSGEQEAARLRLANELLEQQYIVATDYLDLPRAVRPALQAFFDAAAGRYARVRSALSPGRQQGLFFREEEIRWARAQTIAADEQGL